MRGRLERLQEEHRGEGGVSLGLVFMSLVIAVVEVQLKGGAIV